MNEEPLFGDVDLDARELPPHQVVTQSYAPPQEAETAIVIHSPLDLPVATFKAGLDRRGENRRALIDWVRSSLVEGIDFGSVPTKRGPSKPSLWKPGAEKICGMLGVSVSFPTLKEYEAAAVSGIAIDTIILRCELRDGAQNTLAEGVGARSVAKEYGDTNKALKMAEKSAHIDATLRLAGLSEVFTQDLEDMKDTEDLTPLLEKSIEEARVKKAREAALSPAVREMLDLAAANRAKEQAKLDEKPTDRQKLKDAGFDVGPEPDPNANVCSGCGAELIKGGPVKKIDSKWKGRMYWSCPNSKAPGKHTWRAI